MIENVANLPIEKLFGKNNNNKEIYYRIPPYQREYAWGKNQWENLFNDIDENDAGYFLGSIICISNNDSVLDVVDGQQRLSTLSILLNAVLFSINEYNKNNPEEKILDLHENEDYTLSAAMLKKLLYIKDERAKITLSIQNSNNEDYLYLLHSNKLLQKVNKPSNFGNRRIGKSYEYFKKRLNEIDDYGERIYAIDNIFGFLQKILSASLVKIEVGDTNSAFILFESINNRGIPLTPIDLIKNSIIGEMEKINNKNPEETNREWQVIIKNIEGYNDQVRFLRHYYHAFQHSAKKQIKISTFTKATKSNIITIYSKHIKTNVNLIFNELIEKSKTYSIFIHPEKIEKDMPHYKYQEKLVDLQRLGIAPVYSLLLYLFNEKPHYDFTKLLDFIENWFLRRHLTDYPATNKLDQIFLDLIGQLYEDETTDIFDKVKLFLKDSRRYKGQKEFLETLKNDPIYEINTNATRCLLVKLEKSKRTRENKVDFWEVTGTKKPTLVWSIEHIYPQKPDGNSDWKNYFSKEDKENYLHRLGNLTLTCYNSKLSNYSYSKKISILDSKSGEDIGLKSGNVKINEYLLNKQNDIWTPEDINKRGAELANDIIKILD